MSFTPTIERRSRIQFRFFDLNQDGYLSSKDLDELNQKLTEIYKTDAKDTMKEALDKWWAMIEHISEKKTVTEEEYINFFRFLYVTDFAMLRKRMFNLFEAGFSLIDHNKDNKISLDEFMKFDACFNVTDTDRVKKIFQKLDLDRDGFVTRDEWIIAQLDFITRDDPDHDFGFMFDPSSPVPEYSSTGRLTPNLLKRYKMIFRFYDINKDGFHTLEDYLLVCDNICTLHDGPEEERAALRDRAAEWWKNLEGMAIDGKVTEEHFVYMFITHLVTDFESMRHDILIRYRRWFDLADQDLDGMMSQEEFCKFYAACNVKDTEKTKNIFKQLDLDDDGFISEEEWILANLDYWTRDDSTYDYGFIYDI